MVKMIVIVKARYIEVFILLRVLFPSMYATGKVLESMSHLSNESYTRDT